MQQIRKRLHGIFSQSSLGFDDEETFSQTNKKSKKTLTFPDILIDVSKYDDRRLLQNSLHLLNRCKHVIAIMKFC